MIETLESPSPKFVFTVGALVFLSFFCLGLAGSSWLLWNMLERGECGTGDATLRDELRVRTFAAGVLRAPEWNEQFSVQPFHVMRTWLSDTYSAVVFVDYILYNCGYTREEVEAHYTPEAFQTEILANYQDIQRVTACETGNTRLYVHTVQWKQTDYLTHTWVMPDGAYRILQVVMVFPADKRDVMNQYAAQLFPNLPACP